MKRHAWMCVSAQDRASAAQRRKRVNDEMAALIFLRAWDDSFHGYVAYVDEEPVAATLTAPVDGRLCVSWVATHPAHRRKGYADAVMRKSLESAREATGLQRTVLHATPAGQPVYEAMGYRPVVGFTWYGVKD